MFESRVAAPEIKSNSIHLQNLLKRFFEAELLNNIENYYTCGNCRKREDLKEKIRFIKRKFFLYQPSQTVVISLKRFRQSQSRWGGSFSKIDTSVGFEFSLDLSPFVLSKKKINFKRKKQPKRRIYLRA